MPGRRRWPCIVLLVASLAVILGLTLTRSSTPHYRDFWCVLCGEFGLADAVANVVLFVPFAIALRCSGVSGGRTVAMGLLLSAIIEFVQQRSIPGRVGNLGDLTWNTLGATLGVALVWWLPARRASTVRALVATGATLATFAGAGLVLRPSLPPTIYYGQWTADLGMYEWYRGRVLDARIDHIPVPSQRLEDSRAAQDAFLRGGVVRIRAIAGPRTQRLAPLFSILDERQREIILVGPERDDLVLHVRTGAADLRLTQPDLRWRGALEGVASGDTLVVEVHRASRGYCVRVNDRERCDLAFTAGRAWGIVKAFPDLPASAKVALDCLWMTLLGLPVGLVARRGRSTMLVAAIAVAGAVVVPLLVGLAPTPGHQLAALALGIAVGSFAPPGPRRAEGDPERT